MMNVERLTARTHDGHAYLANVKDDEQEVCASMTVLNGKTYCDSVPCVLRDKIPPQTNADRIRNMSDEELAKWLIQMSEGDDRIKFCKSRPECNADLDEDREIPQERCAECMLDWLCQPVEE